MIVHKEIHSLARSLMLPGVSTELRRQVSRSRSVTLLAGNPIGNVRTERSGVSARVCKRGVYGFASMADDGEEAVREVLRAANENAAFMDRNAPKGAPATPRLASGSYAMNCAVSDPEQRLYMEFARELDAYIVASCPRLCSRTVAVRVDSTEKELTVSSGISAHTVLPRAYVYLMMTAATPDGTPVELFSPVGGYGSFDKIFTSPAALYPEVDRLYEMLMDKTEGVRPEAGIKTVILGGVLSGMLAHEAVGHTVEADLVLGGSVAAHSLGRIVASPLVSLTDFAHTAFGAAAPLPVYVDDEGTPATDAPIIRDGVLVGYLNSRETAAHFGMQPTGNARAYAFSDEPLIRMRNTAIHPGSSSLSDMIASVEDGYYLVSTGNGQADTTGEFMFGVNMGYEIKGGKLGRALLDTTISGVAFEMLKTVDMVSDGVTWSSSGYCGKKQPMPVGMGGPALRCKMLMGGN